MGFKYKTKKTSDTVALVFTVCQAGQGFGRPSQITALAED